MRDVLVVDVGTESLRPLATRMQRLGLRVLVGKTTDEAQAILGDSRYAVGTIVIPPDLPTTDLRSALASLKREAPDPSITVVVSGPRPDAAGCEGMRRAGVDLALFGQIDDHTLRFQLNRALADDASVHAGRRAVRVPADWPVRVRTGQRSKDARLYSLSCGGAYLATPRPSLRGSLLFLTLPLPSGPVEITGRVVLTNVPGNLERPNLPLGMAIRFTGLAQESEEKIRTWTEEHAARLRL